MPGESLNPAIFSTSSAATSISTLKLDWPFSSTKRSAETSATRPGTDQPAPPKHRPAATLKPTLPLCISSSSSLSASGKNPYFESDHFSGVDQSAADFALETKSAQLAAPADGAMVFECDPSQGVVASQEVLQQHLGLSPRESRVASLISAGERPRSIAVKLGLTEDSARVILKRVFAKAGVSRQSELVALVSHLTSVSLR